jgi:uncharacterized protein
MGPILIEKDVAVPLRDGGTISANVFRPPGTGRHPVIITLGPYPKDVPFSEWNPAAWAKMVEKGDHMHWETVDPEWWVPRGYAVIRCDTRGTGKSPGRPRLLSQAEAVDFHDAVEWAAARPWSNGKVAVMGVSYFAMNAWRVAATRPPHLAAIVPWEGAVDLYRDANRHGGIYSSGFMQAWGGHVRRYQNDGGQADPAPLSPETIGATPDRYAPRLENIVVPLLSAGNWGGVGLHLRGNIEGYLGAGSEHKFLQVHVGDHILPFYSLEGRLTQLRFLEEFLRGVDTGLTREPPIRLAIRRPGDRYRWRYEDQWPIARTRFTPLWLDARAGALAAERTVAPGTTTYSAEPGAARGAATFATRPFAEETEITGPAKLRVWVSSTIDDADLFVVLRDIGPDGEEVTFPGVVPGGNSRVAAAYGWLRASHRKLDPARSTPARPYHAHDEIQKLVPEKPVAVDVEIWPSATVFEPGHRLVLEVRASDDPRHSFPHTDPRDRIQKGQVTLHAGGDLDSHLLVPMVPRR